MGKKEKTFLGELGKGRRLLTVVEEYPAEDELQKAVFAIHLDRHGKAVSPEAAEHFILLSGDNLQAGEQHVVITGSFQKGGYVEYVARPYCAERDLLLTREVSAAINKELSATERSLAIVRDIEGAKQAEQYRTPKAAEELVQQARHVLFSHQSRLEAMVYDDSRECAKLRGNIPRIEEKIRAAQKQCVERRRKIEEVTRRLLLREVTNADAGLLSAFFTENRHEPPGIQDVHASVRLHLEHGVICFYDAAPVLSYSRHLGKSGDDIPHLPSNTEGIILFLRCANNTFLRKMLINQYDAQFAAAVTAASYYAPRFQLLGFAANSRDDFLGDIYQEGGFTAVKTQTVLTDKGEPFQMAIYSRRLSQASPEQGAEPHISSG